MDNYYLSNKKMLFISYNKKCIRQSAKLHPLKDVIIAIAVVLGRKQSPTIVCKFCRIHTFTFWRLNKSL